MGDFSQHPWGCHSKINTKSNAFVEPIAGGREPREDRAIVASSSQCEGLLKERDPEPLGACSSTCLGNRHQTVSVAIRLHDR